MGWGRPRARLGLLTQDHSKRGQRFVTVRTALSGFEDDTHVSLLEPWEHATLLLCDGSRSYADIARDLIKTLAPVAVTESEVIQCVEWLRREALVEFDEVPEQPGLSRPPHDPTGLHTAAELQFVLEEWRKTAPNMGQDHPEVLKSPFLDQAQHDHRQEDVGIAPAVVLAADSASAHEPTSEEETANEVGQYPEVAGQVFERLRSMGLKARRYQRAAQDAKDPRRRHHVEAEQFQTALQQLTRGELHSALQHFQDLSRRLAKSYRIAAFVETIEAVLNHLEQGSWNAGAEIDRLLLDFEGALRDAVQGGHCPKCFALWPKMGERCGHCGFAAAVDGGSAQGNQKQ